VPAVHLTLRVPDSSDQSDLSAAIQQRVFGEYLDDSPEDVSSDPSSIEYALAPGHYLVQGGNPPHIAEVDLANDQELNLATAKPAKDLSVKVQMADGQPVPASLKLTLASGNLLQRKIDAKTVDKSGLVFPFVPPGTWTVLASARGLNLAVVAVQSGTKQKAGEQIDVTGDESDVILSIARVKTQIEGFATQNGKGVSGVLVVLVPKDPVANQAEFKRDQSDSDGSFSLSAFSGDYTVVAIQDGSDLAWKRADVIQRYLAAGIPVTVTDQSEQITKLTATVPVQPR
jgi:hypothetical protein